MGKNRALGNSYNEILSVRGRTTHSAEPLKLVPQPIPKTVAGRARPELILELAEVCAVCGVSGQATACHEVWSYDDAAAIAELRAFEPRCGLCDATTHVARIMREPETLEAALQQLTIVNEIGYNEAARMVRTALKQWETRNRVPWRTTVDQDLLALHPELSILCEQPDQLSLFT